MVAGCVFWKELPTLPEDKELEYPFCMACPNIFGCSMMKHVGGCRLCLRERATDKLDPTVGLRLRPYGGVFLLNEVPLESRLCLLERATNKLGLSGDLLDVCVYIYIYIYICVTYI
jgi:hypothetical protein